MPLAQLPQSLDYQESLHARAHRGTLEDYKGLIKEAFISWHATCYIPCFTICETYGWLCSNTIHQKGFTMTRGAGRFLLAVLTACVFCTSAAYADSFRLRVENLRTGKGVVITDGAAGDIYPFSASVTPPGVIVYAGTIDGFIFNVTTGISKPLIGGVNNYAELDLNSINVKGNGPGTLRITLEDSGYTSGPDGALSAVGLVGGTLSAALGSTATFQSWVNPDNLVPNLGPDASPLSALSSLGATPAGSVALWSGDGVTFGLGAFSSTASEGFIHSGPYALFTQATINFTGAGVVSFDSDLSTVPEPTSLLLLGSGLAALACGAIGRKSWHRFRTYERVGSPEAPKLQVRLTRSIQLPGHFYCPSRPFNSLCRFCKFISVNSANTSGAVGRAAQQTLSPGPTLPPRCRGATGR